ncbi:MAG: hypothetical protein HY595_03700 [Candidatus Omnitrophica bacterium]|nr:hypothetical protein [Candidatus Omnitrophota bacterium]
MDDLLFRSKLEAAAAPLKTPLILAGDASPALRPGSAWNRVFIDLNLSRGGALAMVRALRAAHPGLPVIGYCSHVERDLQQQALEAGCTEVLSRSAFVQQLPELLGR